MTGARTENGLNVRILLPHVVYLNQKEPLRKEQVVLRAYQVDTATGKLRVQLENLGPNLGRVQQVTATAGQDDQRAERGIPPVAAHGPLDRGRLARANRSRSG